MKDKVSIVTLGCDKNRVDSEVMAGVLYNAGYEITTNEREADFIIINTCTFIKEAKRETEDAISKALEYKKAKVVIMGCHVQRLKGEIEKKFPDAWGFLDINHIEDIDKVLHEIKEGKKVRAFDPPSFLYTKYDKRLVSTSLGSAYIKISEGCNHNCTFCIIPKIKGRFRSRVIEDIVKEASYLAKMGRVEIILIAQDLNSYGIDIYGKPMLGRLITEISKIEEIRWIRLLYMYPFNFPHEILDLMNSDPKLCKYIDLPLQHISNRILRKMGRKGSKEEILKLLGDIRKKVPDITLRTSFIVGFPGESEEDFAELKQFVEDTKFHWVGVFKYSREKGTYAYSMEEHVPDTIKKQRFVSLMALQEGISRSLNKKRVGGIEEVLIEERGKRSFIGRTQKEAPEIDGIIQIYRAQEVDLGKIKKVSIISSSSYDLSGVLVE